jgi:cell division protein FtsI/penicillin-binding protein 2
MHRARPVLALAAVAFAIGAIVGGNESGSPSYALADRFVKAWTRGDYASMYSEIDAVSQRSTSPSEFAGVYEAALRTATATGARVDGRARGLGGGLVAVPVRVQTRLFGRLALSFTLEVRTAGVEGARVVWSRSLAFPGLRRGETLTRSTALPRRAALLARDGSVLAESQSATGGGSASEGARPSPLGDLASAVLGTVGPVPASRRQALEADGVPPDATVGVSGLEQALDERLRGTPGGELLASGGASQPAGAPGRVLAYVAPRPASATRTSVSPALQRAAVGALGAQLGGIVAMAPSSGQVLAVAGIGLTGLQPPGSTFKMITLSGVLGAKIATPRSVFPYASFATLDGVKLSNANGENCGGSLELAFAVSCNSVFTPLGVKLGAARLVSIAERFGFNHDPGLAGAATSTMPAASQIQGELDVGSTAIGQGQVVASPLEMAIVAATIADGGRRPTPTFTLDAGRRPGTRVLSAAVARTVRHLMIGVVRLGTGTSAAIPGVTVAGKTGTAELKSECTASSSPSEPSSGEASAKESAAAEGCHGTSSEASNTDAWFAAFAPALHPRIVVCVLLVKDGAGGTTAAPVARQVIEAALQAHL